MARNDRDRSTSKRAPKDGARRGKKKVDIIARDSIEWVDYKDVNLLRKFMSDRGKIRARRVSGLSVQNQRAVAKAIKLARELALVPYATRTVTERATPRSRPPRDDRPPRDTELPDVIELDDEMSLLPEEDDE